MAKPMRVGFSDSAELDRWVSVDPDCIDTNFAVSLMFIQLLES